MILWEKVIPLNPKTKKNNGRIVKGKGGKPFLLPSSDFAKYQTECGMYLSDENQNIQEPVNVCAIYFRATRHKVDLANLHEALLDILVHYHILQDDNANIVVSMDGSRVYYDPNNPRTEISIQGV